MKTILLMVVSTIAISCSSQRNDQRMENLNSGFRKIKYYSSDSLSTLNIEFKADSIVGTHCFVAVEGNRIDCCLDKQSIFLKKISKEIFSGIMLSCYDEKQYLISVEIIGHKLIFRFKNDNHEFMSMETSLFELNNH